MHALVTADTIGGVWTYARELVTGLVKHGVRVTLVSFGEIPTAHQTEWLDGLPGLDFRPTGFQLEWMQDAERDLEISSEYLLDVITETRPDVIHLNQYAYGALHVDAPKVVVAHSDVVSWWQAVHGEEPRDTAWLRWYRRVVTSGLAGANTVVAPSSWMLDRIRENFGNPEQQTVIYNGRTPSLFSPHVTKEGYAVSVGRLWDPGKQISLLTETDPPMPVHIAGSEEHADSKLRQGKKSARIKEKFHYRGRLAEPQMRQLLSRAGVYVATSRYEPFGLSPVEAAFSRCAIVANDIPSFRELWGDAAYYFRQNDSASLAQALERMNNDLELRASYANLAYHHARERFTAERMTGEYLALYQSLTRAEVAA